jgi:hypothetical protein
MADRPPAIRAPPGLPLGMVGCAWYRLAGALPWEVSPPTLSWCASRATRSYGALSGAARLLRNEEDKVNAEKESQKSPDDTRRRPKEL